VILPTLTVPQFHVHVSQPETEYKRHRIGIVFFIQVQYVRSHTLTRQIGYTTCLN